MKNNWIIVNLSIMFMRTTMWEDDIYDIATCELPGMFINGYNVAVF